jgi:hypothetical protein
LNQQNKKKEIFSLYAWDHYPGEEHHYHQNCSQQMDINDN